MLRKYIVLIILSFTFMLFSQDMEIKTEEGKTGMVQKKEAVNKLSRGMTKDEVIKQIGEPAEFTNITFIYPFNDNECLRLQFSDGKLFVARDKDWTDLLSEYTAEVSDINSFLIDQVEVLSPIPIVTINEKIYVPIGEIAIDLKINVNLNKEKQVLEIATNAPPPQNIELTRAEKNSGIEQMREAIGKLRIGMEYDKVIELVGRPTHDIGYGGYVLLYLFTGKETFSIDRDLINFSTDYSTLLSVGEVVSLDYDYDQKLLNANTKDLNLLRTEYPANHIGYSVFINEKELIFPNPIVTIGGNIYVPIEDLAEQLGITVSFNEEKQQLEIVTKKEN